MSQRKRKQKMSNFLKEIMNGLILPFAGALFKNNINSKKKKSNRLKD